MDIKKASFLILILLAVILAKAQTYEDQFSKPLGSVLDEIGPTF